MLYVQWLQRKFTVFKQFLEAVSCDEKSLCRCQRFTLSTEERLVGLDFLHKLNLFLDVIKIQELVARKLLFVVFDAFHQFFLVWRSVKPLLV